MKARKQGKPGADATWLKIATPEAGYAGGVVTLVARIARTRSGRAVLESMRDSGRNFRIEKPQTPTNPPNAWAERRGLTATERADVVVCFDPADWPSAAEPDPRPADVVLFELLEAAARMAAGADAPVEGELSPTPQAYLRERAPPAEVPGQ